ncbi:MAG: HAMP domain-containing protein [Acidobacteriaceae bacterium]|nr:HAMP domain-containing protein [Acidobacteriaceae bacterium]
MWTSRRQGLSLAWKFLLCFSAVLVTLIFAMLVYVNFLADRFVVGRTTEDLLQGQAQINSAVKCQLSALSLTARVVGSFHRLREAMDKTDLPSVRNFLFTYQQENRGPDLLIVLDGDGRVLARTDSLQRDPVRDVKSHWTAPALSSGTAQRTLYTRDAVYNAAIARSETEGHVFGFVLAGSRMDNTFARELRSVSDDEIVILGDRVIGSTIPGSVLPWHSRADWHAKPNGSRGGDAVRIGTGRYLFPPALQKDLRNSVSAVRIGAETYFVLPTTLAYAGAPLILCLQSADKALAPYQRIQIGLLVLGILAAVIGVAGSALFARRLTAPIVELVKATREVAGGNFDFRLKVQRRDEIGVLAQSFNSMTHGLRERADMQKFVSQSTLQMIQSAGNKALTGERKVLTIFFSDIRGFTSLSEHRDPEQVVKILNRVFTVQARRVKQFSGDIDKFVGDAIVALFAGEDAPINAIRCASEIHKEMQEYNAQLLSNEPPIELGIGISTGEVILGSIGSEDRRDFTAIGSHVNLCARLCGLARPGEILLAESTHREVRNVVTAERLPARRVKGFSDPVAVYKVES